MTYDDELLSKEKCKAMVECDDELPRTFLESIQFKLKSTNLAKKHTKRMILLFKIPTLEMEMDNTCLATIDAWSKRSAPMKEKVASHAK